MNRGETIKLFVNTADPTYSISIYRIGWYGGKGARQVAGPISRTGRAQPTCLTDLTVGLVQCDWQDPFLLQTEGSPDHTEWASGIYLAKLTGSRGKQAYIIFAVRDDSRAADLLFQQSVITYAAYNNWGGYSLYPYNSINKLSAFKVSFNRPYSAGSGTGDFFSWELNALRFLEREGYDVSYGTNIDVHERAVDLLQYKAVLSVGHDEYWTRAIRDEFERAVSSGVNLGFFGANAAYWQVRLEPDRSGGDPNRTVVEYRGAADPLIKSDPLNSTSLFRAAPINRPESSLIGVSFDYAPVDSDIVISDCSTLSWICAGTGLQTGSVLRGLLGREVDRTNSSSPSSITVIASSPYSAGGQQRYSNMTYYVHRSGAGVFATGSLQWSWGLDSYGRALDTVNAAAQQLTRNVLNNFTRK